jgi:site-specific DNA-cytosine methylase
MFGSAFSGMGVGLATLPIPISWGIEKSLDLVNAYSLNYPSTIYHHSVEEIAGEFYRLSPVRALQVSPECHNYTPCKIGIHGAGETGVNLDQALAILTLVKFKYPEYFVLENAWLYRNSASFAAILAGLHQLTYKVSFRCLDSSNYGVAQSRKRLFLVATRQDKPNYRWPAPTTNKSKPGWLSAIADLIPGLPDSEFPDYQLPYIPKTHIPILVDGQLNHAKTAGRSPGITIRFENQPCFTIGATVSRRPIKIRLLDGTVKQLNTRCIARLMGLPDSFKLPDNRQLALKGLGNGITPAVLTALVNQMEL